MTIRLTKSNKRLSLTRISLSSLSNSSFSSSSAAHRGRGCIVPISHSSTNLFFKSPSYNNHYFYTTSTYSSFSSSSPIQQPQYSVAKVNYKGEVSVTTQCISEILKRIHARDLFSLSLTSTQESEKQHSKQASFRRRKKRSPTAILPRQEDIIVSFGPIRAVIGPTEGMIFDAHKPSVQLLAKGIGETFAARRRFIHHSASDNLMDEKCTNDQ